MKFFQEIDLLQADEWINNYYSLGHFNVNFKNALVPA